MTLLVILLGCFLTFSINMTVFSLFHQYDGIKDRLMQISRVYLVIVCDSVIAGCL
jgi:hypothetical protein